ncbi:FecR family protein [Halopseudomonas litoralis]|uniref:FecR family protein n=1 Tax=Halopseudomonas litoralis TaxID=797277 RepID=A0A1H1Q6H1_9GAMM|nr:DUF4880 domain-containing protein [Halopseudomonas litoralis]SDS18990.1 FecR family protein [Halopseudomonas litoralis]
MPPSTDNHKSEPNAADPELIQEQARCWLVRITSGNMSPDEAESFKSWCAQSQLHARTFAETSRAWRLLDAAAKLNTDTPVALPPRQLSRRHFLAAAAGLTGVAMVAHFGMRTGISLGTDNSIQTARGEQKRLNISSDIAITLNTLTHIEMFDDNTSTHQHRLRLVSGEMDVQCSSYTKGINIVAAGGEIKSSDAHINIKHINDSVQVTCLQGLTEVSFQGQNARIGPGEQIRYSPSSFSSPTSVDASSVSAWLNRVLVFDDIPLGTVIEEVNRYRSGKILLLNSKVAERRVQARFELDRLDEVITLLTDVYGIKSLSLPGGVVVLT